MAVPLGGLGGEPGRSDRRPRRPRATGAAGRLRRQLHRRPAADPPRREAFRRARLRDRRARPWPSHATAAARAGEPAGERQLQELRLLIAAADPLRGARGRSTTSAPPARCCPRSRRCAASSRTPTTISTCSATRSRSCASCSSSRATSSGSPAIGRPSWPGCSPSRSPTASRGARRCASAPCCTTSASRRRATTVAGSSRSSATTTRGRGSSPAICERLRASRALEAYLRGVTLHHLRLGFLAGERPLAPRRVHEYLRATEPVSADVTLLTVADRLSARGEGPIASPEMVSAHLELAREMLGRRARPPPRRPAAVADRGRRARGRARDRGGAGAGAAARGDRGGRLRRRGHRAATTRSRSRAELCEQTQ